MGEGVGAVLAEGVTFAPERKMSTQGRGEYFQKVQLEYRGQEQSIWRPVSRQDSRLVYFFFENVQK